MRTPLLAALAVSLAAVAPAHAGTVELGDLVQAKTSDYYRGWILSKLTKINVGAKCEAKLVDPEGRVMDLQSYYTREVAGYAKQVTGDDWATIEGSGTSEKAANKGKVEPMIDAFKSKFSFTVNVDGDDCDAGHDPLWMQYVMRAAEAVNRTPPAAGKAFIVINASSKVKTFAIAVSKDGATFTLTGPKDIAARKWQDQVAAAFTKAAKKK